MKIAIKPSSSFRFSIVLGTVQLGLAAWYYTSNVDWFIDNRLLSLIWLIAGVITVYKGFKEYEHVWEITNKDECCSITKNGKVVFMGNPTELLAVKRDHNYYLIYPRKGDCIKVPQSNADQCILELYKAKNN